MRLIDVQSSSINKKQKNNEKKLTQATTSCRTFVIRVPSHKRNRTTKEIIKRHSSQKNNPKKNHAHFNYNGIKKEGKRKMTINRYLAFLIIPLIYSQTSFADEFSNDSIRKQEEKLNKATIDYLNAKTANDKLDSAIKNNDIALINEILSKSGDGSRIKSDSDLSPIAQANNILAANRKTERQLNEQKNEEQKALAKLINDKNEEKKSMELAAPESKESSLSLSGVKVLPWLEVDLDYQIGRPFSKNGYKTRTDLIPGDIIGFRFDIARAIISIRRRCCNTIIPSYIVKRWRGIFTIDTYFMGALSYLSGEKTINQIDDQGQEIKTSQVKVNPWAFYLGVGLGKFLSIGHYWIDYEGQLAINDPKSDKDSGIMLTFSPKNLAAFAATTEERWKDID
jgi:hypothetical protein